MDKKDKQRIIVLCITIVIGFIAGYIIGELIIRNREPQVKEKSAYEILQEGLNRKDVSDD